MKIIKKVPKLPAIIFASSFLLILSLAGFTEPSNNILLAAAFFTLLLAFLTSLGIILEKLGLTFFRLYRTVTVSLFIVISLMFLSSQSLSWVDGLILLLTVSGALFYGGRRFTS